MHQNAYKAIQIHLPALEYLFSLSSTLTTALKSNHITKMCQKIKEKYHQDILLLQNYSFLLDFLHFLSRNTLQENHILLLWC